jgi:hypothetical protein
MNLSMKRPPRRGALTSLETGLIGCGSLALVVFICSGVAVYFAIQNAKKGMSSDPKQIREWLQAEVKCDPPKGYECVRGANFSAMGSAVGSILVAPPDAKLDEKTDFDPEKTTFLLIKAPMADSSRPKETGDRKETSVNDVVVSVSEKKVKAVRREVTQGGTKRIEYQVPLRKSLVFLAVGPAHQFDSKAMEDFLGTMRLDQPFDLPTEVKDAGKEAKEKSK